MTEEEIKKQLFDLHLQYMKYTPKQKEELHEEHIQKLKQIRRQLALLTGIITTIPRWQLTRRLQAPLGSLPRISPFSAVSPILHPSIFIRLLQLPVSSISSTMRMQKQIHSIQYQSLWMQKSWKKFITKQLSRNKSIKNTDPRY